MQRGRPPCCTASPLGRSSSSSDPSGILKGKERARREAGEEVLLARVSTLDPDPLVHFPQPLSHSATQLQPHLPPGKQQEEHLRLRGCRREGGGKETEPEPPEGDGVGGLRPMTGAGSQHRDMAKRISKTQ